MTENESILILGGTFDPIHIGHLIITQSVLNTLNIKNCLFIPSAIPPHKTDVHTNDDKRLKMVEIALMTNTDMKVSNIELMRKEPSYTLITLQDLHNKYNYRNIYFLIGSDILPEIKTWYRYQEILNLCRLLVVPRLGYSEYFSCLESIKAGENSTAVNDDGMKYLIDNIDRVEIVNTPIIDISSTYIRKLIKQKKSINYLVPDGVIEYIEDNGLYS